MQRSHRSKEWRKRNSAVRVLVWGEDWHEGVIGIVDTSRRRYHRLSSHRGNRRVGRLGALDFRRSFSNGALGACSTLASDSAVIVRLRVSRSRGSGRAVRRGLRGSSGRAARTDDLVPAHSSATRFCRVGAKLTLELCESCALSRSSVGKSRVTLLARAASSASSDRRRRKHLQLPRPPSGSDAGGAIASDRGPSSTLPTSGTLRRGVSPAGEPWRTDGVAATRRASVSSTRTIAQRALPVAANAMVRAVA